MKISCVIIQKEKELVHSKIDCQKVIGLKIKEAVGLHFGHYINFVDMKKRLYNERYIESLRGMNFFVLVYSYRNQMCCGNMTSSLTNTIKKKKKIMTNAF